MMTRIVVLLFGLGAAVTATPTAAKEDEKAASACSATDGPTMTIGEITVLGDMAIGRCVTVDGWALGYFLQADNEARYRQQRIYNDYTSTGVVLGLYGRDRGAPPAIIRATGRIDSCKAVYDRIIAAGDIPFLGGFCHYHYGLVINASSVTEIGKPDIVRIPANAAAPGIGNLSRMVDGKARDTLLATFAPLLDALVKRDGAALRQLLRIESGAPMTEDRLAERVAALTAADSPVTALPSDGSAVVEVFGWREPLWADEKTRMGNAAAMANTTSGIVCAAPPRTAEERLWPIDDADAGFARGRPYVCARIFIGALKEGGERVTQYAVYPERRSIREPA
ncbi:MULTISPECIES: hypothetical protein [unclassified Sphingopyxis]|uniref:hypothetical protein n=1 Tax=unclassified Sphingopyxis TaxID=2614943 RepID=UPI0025FA04B9|nr:MULTISPECIES: hypothetical protein [unclassified Sphingopyxis]